MIRADELASLLVARSGPLTHEKLVTVYQHVLEHIPHPYDFYSIGYDKYSFLTFSCRRMPPFWWLDESCRQPAVNASFYAVFSDDAAIQIGKFIIAHCEQFTQYNVLFYYAPPGVVARGDTRWEHYLSYRMNSSGVMIGFGVDFKSALANDAAARTALFTQVFHWLGLADRVSFAVEDGKMRVLAPGLRVRSIAGDPNNPLAVNIGGADDLRGLEARARQAIAALGEPFQIALSCDAGAEQFREFAPAYNTLAEGWYASMRGRFRPDVDPFSHPNTLPDDVEVEFPLLAWNAHRTESGTICLWVAHTPAGACFQATCNRGDMAKLLKKLERKLGIPFTPYFDGKMVAESRTVPGNG